MKFVTLFALLSVAVAAVDPEVEIDETVPRVREQNHLPPNGDQLPVSPPDTNKTYEYIIVGSGAGGSPLAARLAQAGHSVLLIDAGADHGRMKEVEVPALSIHSSERNEFSWGFYTHHYENIEQAKRDRKYTYRTREGNLYSGVNPPEGAEPLGNFYPRVGALGGCTEHHALIMILPADDDWSYIQNLTGDSSWDPENMRGYFRKLEKNRYLPSDLTGAHGYTGWLETALTPLTLIAQDVKLLSMVVAAATAFGLQTEGLVSEIVRVIDGLLGGFLGDLLPVAAVAGIVDGLATLLLTDINNNSPNRDTETVLAQIPLSMSIPDYKRTTPRNLVYEVATATNDDGTKKYPLDIALNTLVTKVNFDTTGEKPRAISVDYLYGESLYRADPRSSLTVDSGIPGTISATREIIVSGGTFNTPQILKLSGVGPAEELEKFGIPVIKDLPGVGTNLQDRYEVGVSATAESEFALIKDCTFLEGDDPCYDQWEGGLGLLKGAYTTNGIALAVWNKSSVAEGAHDLWIGGIPALFQGYFPGYSKKVLENKHYWTWLILKAHGRNNGGTVNLTSANPRDPPDITFHSFGEGSPSPTAAAEDAEKDLQAVLEGIRYAESVYADLLPLDGNFTRVWPPPEEVASDGEYTQWARDEAWGHHASSSCPIGVDGDPRAVLDGDFRVRGVDGLRVVDMSIFPKIIGTFPVLGLYMVSEKAAGVILADAA